MWRMKRDDEGAVLVLVTIGMAFLLLMAAFALDIGQLVAHKERAQNSADATALAAAINCAQGKPSNTAPLPDLQAGQALDKLETCGETEPNTVKATVSKPVDFQFAPDDTTTRRSARARWDGTVNQANVLPITIAECEWSQALLDGTADITLYLDDPKKQNGCSSLPGGFSQLQSGDTTCSIDIDANGDAPGKPGGDLKKKVPCITNPTNPKLPKDVLIPIYDQTVLSKADHDNGHGPYHILGFAAFHVTGYSFNGNANGGTLGKDCPARPADPTNPGAKDPKHCIRGDFIGFLAPGDAVPGPSQSFGVVRVYLFE
jgi:hypothetical protein